MLLQHFDWDLTHQVLSLYVLSSNHINFRDQPWRLHILWCRTDICTCKLSAKESLMLDNLCKLNHISVCFIQISTKITCKQLIPFRENHVLLGFFGSDPRCFGLLDKFQHNIEISIKTTRVNMISVRFLWLWLNEIFSFWKPKISLAGMFHESLIKQFSWNLMLRYTVKLTLN